MKTVRFVITCPDCQGRLWVEAELEKVDNRYLFDIRHVDRWKPNVHESVRSSSSEAEYASSVQQNLGVERASSGS
jgi:hypothetical protein